MERYKCKLCSRTFINGKALGGHMKAHFATLPLPPPNPQPQTQSHHTPSISTLLSFSSSSENEQDQQTVEQRDSNEKSLMYRLRENPKKCFKLSDPKFSFSTTETIVHDRESETESKNPTQKRKLTFVQNSEQKKLKQSLKDSHSQLTETEPEPVTSLFNFSPEEEAAITLMMLSRDKWKINVAVKEEEQEVCGKYKSHRSICLQNETKLALTSSSDHKIFQCVLCPKVFGSYQALGGHKKSHLYPSLKKKVKKLRFFDLNLPR